MALAQVLTRTRTVVNMSFIGYWKMTRRPMIWNKTLGNRRRGGSFTVQKDTENVHGAVNRGVKIFGCVMEDVSEFLEGAVHLVVVSQWLFHLAETSRWKCRGTNIHWL